MATKEGVMSLYRTVDVEVWDDEKFLGLSDSAKMLWLLLLTGPQTSAVPGLQLADALTLASSLRKPVAEVALALDEVVAAGMAEVDSRLRMIRLVNGIKRNAPENPNQLKGLWSAWQNLQASPLKFVHVDAIKRSLVGKWWADGCWAETFGTLTQTVTQTVPVTVTQRVTPTLSKQEKEKEKEKEVIHAQSASPTGVGAGEGLTLVPLGPTKPTRAEIEAVYQGYPRKQGKTEGLKRMEREIRNHEMLAAFRLSVENYVRSQVGVPKDKILYFSSFTTEWQDWTDADVVAAAMEARQARASPQTRFAEPPPRAQPQKTMAEIREDRERQRREGGTQ